MDPTIILTIGKYAILVAIYAFVLVVFRGIMRQLASESARAREAADVSSRNRRVSVRRQAERRLQAPRTEPSATELSAESQPQRAAASEPAEAAPSEAEDQAASTPPPLVQTAPEVDVPGESRAAAMPEEEAEPAPEPQPPAPSPVPADSTEPAAPHLLVLESGDEARDVGDSIALSAAVTIGRAEENSLQIADRFISSRHALLCLRDGRRILVDRGSTNGTFVNGERVEDEIELVDGDRIALGNTVLEYHAG